MLLPFLYNFEYLPLDHPVKGFYKHDGCFFLAWFSEKMVTYHA